MSSAKAPVPVSVAIPCDGNEASLAKALAHILECRPLPQEILIHFDGQWQPKQDFAANAPVPVRIFRTERKLGPGGGRDLMFKAAACDVVCSFDDDSWPLDPDYFEQALKLMEAFPNAALLSPEVYLREKPKLPKLAEVCESVSFEGSASITRRSHYLQLPGYVPVPEAYGVEEVDLSLQAHAAGFQILRSPWLRAWHDRPYADFVHGLLPWVKNEVLLAYLRYPRWLQPWGWLRSVRHVLNHYSPRRLGAFLLALGNSPAHCRAYRPYVRRYGIKAIWNHHFGKVRRWKIDSEGDRVVPSLAPQGQRVLYIQYTNPAAYPPLQHSSQLLAVRGWEVLFVGISGRGTTAMHFPPFPRIRQSSLKWCAPGIRQKLHYLQFIVWCSWKAWRFKPHWIYCSDPLSASPGVMARWFAGARLVYHEHDSPAPASGDNKWFARFTERQRKHVAAVADAVVLPNQARLDAFQAEHAIKGASFCIWNCPALADLPEAQQPKTASGTLRVLYHGSVVPERLPAMKLEALAECNRDVTLRVIGYEVPGNIGYTDKLKAEAERLGVGSRFEYLGTLPQRSDLMARAAECDVGLSLLQYRSSDINMRHMVGASNKPFDYLSQGLALIVPSEQEWQRLYVNNGCAITCEPGSKDELIQVFQWLADHREKVLEMGKRGQQLVASSWNYEAQFEPLLQLMDRQ